MGLYGRSARRSSLALALSLIATQLATGFQSRGSSLPASSQVGQRQPGKADQGTPHGFEAGRARHWHSRSQPRQDAVPGDTTSSGGATTQKLPGASRAAHHSRAPLLSAPLHAREPERRQEQQTVLALPSSQQVEAQGAGKGTSRISSQGTWSVGSFKAHGRKRVGNKRVALPLEVGEGEEFVDLMVHHASAVYVEDTRALASWACSRCTIQPVDQFHLTSLIIDKEALLQAYVGVHHDKRLVVVCFRGTHSTYIKNWIDDLWALELDLNFPGIDHAYVHRGFYYAYHKSKLKPEVTHEVLRLMAANPTYPVAITGHSLGAALASLCGLDLVLNFNVPSDRVSLATFGSPRVGNSVFADFFKTTLPFSVRVTHGRDMVVHLPPHTPHSGLLAYHHVAQELWYHRPSIFSSVEVSQACDESGEDLACSRSVSFTSVRDHLTYLGVPVC